MIAIHPFILLTETVSNISTALAALAVVCNDTNNHTSKTFPVSNRTTHVENKFNEWSIIRNQRLFEFQRTKQHWA